MATADQIKIIHVLISKLNVTKDTEFKGDLISKYSAQKHRSSKELTVKEATALIKDLQREVDKLPKTDAEELKERKRNLFLHYCHKMMWYTDNSTGAIDESGRLHLESSSPSPPEERQLDFKQIDGWCLKYGMYKKEFSKHTVTELSGIIEQIKKAYKHLSSKI